MGDQRDTLYQKVIDDRARMDYHSKFTTHACCGFENRFYAWFVRLITCSHKFLHYMFEGIFNNVGSTLIQQYQLLNHQKKVLKSPFLLIIIAKKLNQIQLFSRN